MKYLIIHAVMGLTMLTCLHAEGQIITREEAKSFSATTYPGEDQVNKAGEWVDALHLKDNAKAKKVRQFIVWHLKDIRDWHNSHSYEAVPAGINPRTGDPLSKLARQIIIDSSIPDSVHNNLMQGLKQYLTDKQVEAILDKYTIGKVAFTFKAYQTIVPDLTEKEGQVILNYLKQAREQAIDFKSMKEISAIFEIYKTKCEHYLNTHGRNWRDIYKAYYKKVHSKG